MPVTFKVAQHAANQVDFLGQGFKPLQSPFSALAQLMIEDESATPVGEVFQSSLSKAALSSFSPCHNGLVRTVVQAYNRHHHLIIRPDDVWISILSQLNFYVNAHAEELRDTFVSHEGQKELVVRASGTRYTVDFGDLSHQMSEKLKENIKRPDFHELIIPKFSTTTESDVVIASVMMMSTLKAYFSYKFMIDCGIPSITLLGTQADWRSLAARVEKMDSFNLGEEVSAWCCLLRPVIAQFIAAFDQVDLQFWSRICSYIRGGSGPDVVGGWITAFCPWNNDGKWRAGPHADIISAASMLSSLSPLTWGEDERHGTYVDPYRPLVYGGMKYPVIGTDDLPHGYCEVDVLVDDNGEEFKCMMLAGHIGVTYSSSGDQRSEWDTLQTAAHWFIFVKDGTGDSGKNVSDQSGQVIDRTTHVKTATFWARLRTRLRRRH